MTKRILAAVLLLVVLVSLAKMPRAARAADKWPVLIVPASKVPLEVSIPLPKEVAAGKSDRWQLVEADGAGGAIAAALSAARGPDGLGDAACGEVTARFPPISGAKGSRRYRLEPATGTEVVRPGFQWKPIGDKSLGLWEAEKPVFVYNFGTITNPTVPAKDPRRNRGCFVHPLYGLGGEVLTESFPRDHYHHVGLFWAWPHVEIDGKEYDLWINKGVQQKFIRWLGRDAGPIAATLGVENGWFVGEKQVMIERIWLRAYQAANTHRAIDVDLVLIPVAKSVTLRGAEGKSYGGLNLRYAPRKEKETLITVPSGPAKADLPDTPLPWSDLSARFPGASEPSGAAIFVHPDHPNYPPTWLTRHYGILCVGWPGVKAKTFPPGKPVRLSYRLWIHKSAGDLETFKRAYEGYVTAARVKWGDF